MKPRISGRLFWMCSVLIMTALACQNPLSSATPTAPVSTAVNTSQASIPITGPKQAGMAPVSLPAQRADQGGDPNSSVDATKKQAPTGDSFVNGLFERPFNSTTMDIYYPYLDILQTQGYKDDTWGFATISMSGTDANGHLSGKYGVELDLNKDGRGDWLILALSPSSTDWTTQGVQAWKDTDGDVGGVVPLVADKNPSGGDGYETLVFDQGKSSNLDSAWVRIDPNNPKTIDLAFKLSMLGDPKSYAMGAWAGAADMLNPAMFDFNDHMTHAQAGSPYPGQLYYAIKQLAEIDNTCRLAIGFAATNKDPGMCSSVAPRPGEGGAGPLPPPQQPQQPQKPPPPEIIK